jgi:trehalose/maltose hydrolase-like predicted phosphorylase
MMRTETGWEIIYDQFEPDTLNHLETVTMVGNGYLGTRGSFAEGYPDANRATFVHGVFDDAPIVFTELANVPDWTALTIKINDRRFSLTTGTLHSFVTTLDLKHGVLTRQVDWESPDNQRITITFERFACLHNVHLLMQRVRISSQNFDGHVEVQAPINGYALNEQLMHWQHVANNHQSEANQLVIKTIASNITVSVTQDYRYQGDLTQKSIWDVPMQPTAVFSFHLTVGETVAFEKRTALFTSRDTANPSQAGFDLLDHSKYQNWDQIRGQHAEAWNALWSTSDVKIDSDDDAQIMVRFCLYQLLIAGPQHDDQVNIGAKTLSGYGYRGHVFWDTEIFMLPFFTFTQPQIARNLMSYRYHRLPGARKKAKANGYDGAQFPWESADSGEEVTPPWVPAWVANEDGKSMELVRIWTGDIQIHITADVAYAIMQYWQITGDDDFMLKRGAQVILETAQFWASRLEWNQTKQRYEITDVIGPDENHDHIDNNAFTNRMVVWHLQTAGDVFQWLASHHDKQAAELLSSLGITKEVIQQWQKKATLIYFPEVTDHGIIEQFDGFFDLDYVDFSQYADRKKSMQEIFGIEGTQKVMALKQADVVMLMYLLRDQFALQTIEANYDYYTIRTDHEYGSSLGPAMHAIVAAMIDRREEAYQHFLRAAKADLYDVRGNIKDGIHAASLGGVWQAVVFGFTGLRVDQHGWCVNPTLPDGWRSIEFSFYHKGELERVRVTA